MVDSIGYSISDVQIGGMWQRSRAADAVQRCTLSHPAFRCLGTSITRRKRNVFVLCCLITAVLLITRSYAFWFFESNGTRNAMKQYNATIDVALIVLDQKMCRQVHLLMKSIFGRPAKPIEGHVLLHVVCYPLTCYSLLGLFQTWRVDNLSFVFYDLIQSASFHIISSLTDTGLLKHLLHEILPYKVKRVILLDIGVIVLGEIEDLWTAKSAENPSTLFAMAKSQSLTAARAMYDSSVVIMNLDRMRNAKWSHQLQRFLQQSEAVKSDPSESEFLMYSLEQNRWLVAELGCYLNVQLDTDRDPSQCIPSGDFGLVKLMSWKSVDQRKSGNPTDALLALRNKYRDIQQSLVKMDGNLLRRYVKSPSFSVFGCSYARQEERMQRRIHPYYYGSIANTAASRANITLVTQSSVDRLGTLEKIVGRWSGPISLVIYLSDDELPTLEQHITASPFLADNGRLAVHLVYKEGAYYPTNTLRNVAMDYAQTTHVFIFDIDFIPNADIYENLLRALPNGFNTKTTAFIVPAFETFEKNLAFPMDKSALLDLVRDGKVTPARLRTWRFGHQTTDFDRWYLASTPYQIKWEAEFEPYVVVPRDAGRFDARFVGFGWDKVAFFLLLTAKEFKYVVLPEPFMVHSPHTKTKEDALFHYNFVFRSCIETFRHQYIGEIARKYGRKWKFYPRLYE